MGARGQFLWHYSQILYIYSFTTCVIVYKHSYGFNFGGKHHILGGKGNMKANLRGEECRRGQNRALGREFVGHV